jgi:putative ABC transport system permease protein
MSAPSLAPSRLLPGDILRVGSLGLRTRRLRAALSVLGIAIGIAALVAVVGISESSKADLLAQLDRLGTNLLSVEPGQSFVGADVTLPTAAGAMIGRIGPVEETATVADVDAGVRRNDLIDEQQTGGIAVKAADTTLLSTLNGGMGSGRFLSTATETFPTVVLGSVAAERLGIDRPGVQVQIGDERFTVIGVMDELPLAQDLDRSALIGFPVAAETFGGGERPDASRVYLRADASQIEPVRGVLAETANPAAPEEVNVSRPSDVLEARSAAESALTSLFLGLGAVALLVGGIGIANVMVISVLERRQEIGLRRALGATRRHVGAQFLTESLLLAVLGGVAGVLIGVAVTLGWSATQGWTAVIPVWSLFAGLGAALLIGAVAGLYPAMRAARLAPTEALRAV